MTDNTTETGPDTAPALPFRISYIILPLACLALTVLLAAIFYAMLPEEVNYRLQENPDSFIGRTSLVLWLIVPQLLFAFGAFVLVRLVMAAARYGAGDNSLTKRILPLVGNMTGIIQLVIFFAALQIFLYNAYETGTGPLWVPAVVIMVIGGIVLVFRFTGLLAESRRQRNKTSRE